MKLTDWAKKEGISYQSAWRMWKRNQLPYPARQLPTGTLLIDLPQQIETTKNETVYTYSRVSRAAKRDDLRRQKERCREFALARGWSIEREFSEVASGLNDKRKELSRVLNDPPAKLVVEHKDRLTRFGFNYLELLLRKLGCEIVVINRDAEEEADLMKDMIAIVTSFCCRLYGMRSGLAKRKQVERLVGENNDQVNPA